jgi:hypothetical protein
MSSDIIGLLVEMRAGNVSGRAGFESDAAAGTAPLADCISKLRAGERAHPTPIVMASGKFQ